MRYSTDDNATMKPPKPKGQPRGPGRPFQPGNPGKPKGATSKFPRALAQKVFFACQELEKQGKDLGSLAIANPRWFWETFVRPMLPKELTIRTITCWADLDEEERQALIQEARCLLEGPVHHKHTGLTTIPEEK